MIRAGRLDDIDAIIHFALPFVKRLPGPPREPDEASCRQYLARFIEAPYGALFVSTRDDKVTGFISGVIMPDPFTGLLVGMKSSWVVDPDHTGDGGKLMVKLESWARGEGATRMIASHLVQSSDPDIAKFFEARGYVRTEIKYERLL